MGLEIERKFLVTGTGWRNAVARSSRLRQGYLARGDKATARIRIEDPGRAWLTIKSSGGGLSRQEFEYPVPLEDAEAMLGLAASSVIEKRRHDVPAGDRLWQVDVYEGPLAGLVTAEVELPGEETHIDLPGWLGREVTGDRRYGNESLAFDGLPPSSPIANS